MKGTPAPAPRHSAFDDAQALLTGVLFVAIGLALFRQAGLLTGGTAGIAFVLHYATGTPFGLAFFLINLPFYALAWRRMGARFTLKTFAAVTLLALATCRWQSTWPSCWPPPAGSSRSGWPGRCSAPSR